MKKHITAWAFVVSLIISFGLYGNTLKGEFVWDDVFFTQRTELRNIGYIPRLFLEPVLPHQQAASLYRPFTMATFTINRAIHDEPVGFHLVNIFLNALAATLLFRVVLLLFGDIALSIFSALIFMFLPIHTEAVALIKARDEILGTVFTLLAWQAFLVAFKKESLQKKYLVVSAGVFLFGILSKEFVVMAPPLFFIIHWVQKGIYPIRTRLRELGWGALLFGGALGLYLVLRHIAIPETSFGNDEIAPLSNVLIMPERLVAFFTSFKILFLYISKTIIPIGLTASYHFKAVTLVKSIIASPQAMGGLVILVALLWVSFWKKTMRKPFGIGAIIFLVLYLPVSQFLFIGGDIMGERWIYLPSIGIAIMLGWLFVKFFAWNRPLALGVFVCLLVWYGSIVIPRNLVWQNSFSLFSSMVEDSPKSVRGYSALGQYYFEQGRYDDAVAMVNKGFLITNQEPNLYVIAASVAYKQGKFVEAEQYLRDALALPTFSTAAILNFPRILYVQKKYSEALEWYDGAISQLHPAEIGFKERLLYATILFQLKQYNKSIEYLLEQMGSDASHEDVSLLISANYYYLGEKDKAKEYYLRTRFPIETMSERMRTYQPK